MVGNARLELTTPRSQSVCASQLRQFPIFKKDTIYKSLGVIRNSHLFCSFFNGAGNETRTHNPLLGRQML